MIQQRRRQPRKNGSAKVDKTFDKHNAIRRTKDEDENLDLKAIANDPSILFDNEDDELLIALAKDEE